MLLWTTSLPPKPQTWKQGCHSLLCGTRQWKPSSRLEFYSGWTELNKQRHLPERNQVNFAFSGRGGSERGHSPKEQL